jgi:2-amino-4-hydroxy-6-hydroxymethyldihydropteridine diphosphokinase
MTAFQVPCFVALGANLDEPVAKLKSAAWAIAELSGCSDLQASSIYRSAPQETSEAQPDYFNAVISFSTQRSAAAVWKDLQGTERSLGRARTRERNAARTIDIDFLLYGDRVVDSTNLALPHPRITQRAFVLLPLLELAPHISIPHLGAAAQFLDRVKDQRIEKLKDEILLPCS